MRCKSCGKPIPESVIKRRRRLAAYACSRECEVAWRMQRGFYKAMSAAGKAARSAAVAQSNREQPRRRH